MFWGPCMANSFNPSSLLLRTKPRLSSYLFTLLSIILFTAIILNTHDFLFLFRPHLQQLHPKTETHAVLFSTVTQSNNTVQEVEKKEEEEEEEEKECDLFSGRWVKDELTRPLYEESECPYIQPQLTCQEHGRPDKEYRRLRWQPHGCDLPK